MDNPRRTTTNLGMISPNEIGDLLQAGSSASSSMLTAVPIFDGSTIVDPVVVSTSFWDGLTRQFVSLIIGQILAATVFGFISTFAGKQISNLGSFLSENVMGQVNKKELKKPPAGYQGEISVTPDIGKLLQCLVIDSIGTSSELIPFIGEVTDIVWAPIAALLLRSLFPGSNVVFLLEFTEEILPFTDILPLATICWAVETLFPTSGLAKTLQLGVYSQNQEDSAPRDQQRGKPNRDSSIIDVESEPWEGGKGR